MISFNGLWPCLKKGGLYVIEDLMYSYWDQNVPFEDAGLGHPENVVEKFKNLIDTLNKHPVGVSELMTLFPGDKYLCKLSFGMNILAAHKCLLRQVAHHTAFDHWAKQEKFQEKIDRKKIGETFSRLRKTWP